MFDPFILLIPLSFSPVVWALWRFVWNRYIKPSRYYRLIVFDQTELYEYFVKKNKAIIIQDKKGFSIFEKKRDDGNYDGEFYTVSTEEQSLPSKRDDMGTVTFFYWRNNSNPLTISERIEKKIREGFKGYVLQKKKLQIKDIKTINEPINVTVREQIEIDNDASLMYKLINTKMFNSATLEDEPIKKPFNYMLILIIVAIIIIIIVFKDKIISMIG